MVRIYPSLISAHLLNIEHDITMLEPYCDGFHLDIMDNHFVPNLSFGIDMIHAISEKTRKQLWVHLMVDNPHQWTQKISLPSHTIVSFHIESAQEVLSLINLIKEKKWLPSIAINPKTNVNEIFSYLHLIDQLLVMSVEPGFSGQRFLEAAITKIELLNDYRKTNNLSFSIGCDGGITIENSAILAHKGVSDFAIASAIFNAPNPIQAIEQLRKKATKK